MYMHVYIYTYIYMYMYTCTRYKCINAIYICAQYIHAYVYMDNTHTQHDSASSKRIRSLRRTHSLIGEHILYRRTHSPIGEHILFETARDHLVNAQTRPALSVSS